MKTILAAIAATAIGLTAIGSTPNRILFDTPNSSTEGVAIWKTNDFSATIDNPDPAWERSSLPIGNGAFGATVMGSIARDRIVLNEKTLWMGGPATGVTEYWDMNRTVDPDSLDVIRRLLTEENREEAHAMTARLFQGTTPYDRSRFGTFTMMGEAYVSTGADEAAVTDYRRTLDVDSALVEVSYRIGSSDYKRTYFASYPDSLMVWRYVSSEAPQSLQFAFDSPHAVDTVLLPRPGMLVYVGALEGNGMKWALAVAARANDGGKVEADPVSGTIRVTDSKDIEFLLSGDTDYRMNFDPDFSDPSAYVGDDPVGVVERNVENGLRLAYAELLSRHEEDYQNLYRRVSLDLGGEDLSDVPTPQRLAAYREGKVDRGLEQLYFQFGRYLLIASSRPGTMPANLQGLWNNNLDGPWRVDYHNNINLQMNYWPAMSTNLQECFQPFTDYVCSLIVPGRVTAGKYYGARGWTAEVSTNIFGFTAPLASRDMSWNYNPTAGPWLSTQIWEYYDYTRDKDWLRTTGYPIIKGSADFVADLLMEHNGSYTSAPSYSPEHGSCDLGATYANAVTREVLKEAIEASEVLGVDKAERKQWQKLLDNMYPYQIGHYGQLQEWYDDIDEYGDQHRHTNHLFGLHPGSTINPLTDKALADACRETLRQRGDAATGWSMGWKLNHWARLLDGNHAYTLLGNLLKNGTADNLWDLHPPFQIDGNFGGTAGIAELFLQSHLGTIHLLPALPDAWPSGSINGLLARGGFEIGLKFADGQLEEATILSLAGERCKLLYRGDRLDFPTEKGDVYRVVVNAKSGRLQLLK